MRYELKGYRIKRVYKLSYDSIINLISGSTIIALMLTLPTVTVLITIYRISRDAVITTLATMTVHYIILLLLLDKIGSRVLHILKCEDNEMKVPVVMSDDTTRRVDVQGVLDQ